MLVDVKSAEQSVSLVMESKNGPEVRRVSGDSLAQVYPQSSSIAGNRGVPGTPAFVSEDCGVAAARGIVAIELSTNKASWELAAKKTARAASPTRATAAGRTFRVLGRRMLVGLECGLGGCV